MTVCVAIKVHDCIVFASDSATSLSGVGQDGNPQIYNIYSHGNKVFNLHKRLPIVAMTAGLGNFGHSSISTLSKDLRCLFMDGDKDYALNKADYSIKEVAVKARKFFFEDRFSKLDPQPKGEFDFWIGGYSSDQELGEIWRIHISDGQCPEPILEAGTEVSDTIKWGGQPEAINRMLLGYGTELPNALLDAGLQPEELNKLMEHIVRRTQTPVISAAMPTIDAIDLAKFLVETTINYTKFSLGANVVGGEIDLATVTKHEGFKWVARKHYYPAGLNPLETDHV